MTCLTAETLVLQEYDASKVDEKHQDHSRSSLMAYSAWFESTPFCRLAFENVETFFFPNFFDGEQFSLWPFDLDFDIDLYIIGKNRDKVEFVANSGKFSDIADFDSETSSRISDLFGFEDIKLAKKSFKCDFQTATDIIKRLFDSEVLASPIKSVDQESVQFDYWAHDGERMCFLTSSLLAPLSAELLGQAEFCVVQAQPPSNDSDANLLDIWLFGLNKTIISSRAFDSGESRESIPTANEVLTYYQSTANLATRRSELCTE